MQMPVQQDNSGFVDADELVTLYERFKNEQLVAEEEAEELDEEYLKRARCGIHSLPTPSLPFDIL